MPFPTNYKNVQETYRSYQPLATGGHRCKVLAMSIGASANGNRKIDIEFDTAMDDKQPNFFVNSEKKGKFTTIVDDRLLDKNGNPYGLSNLKRLMTSFEDSNPGFKVTDDNYGVNDDLFCIQFINKKIGFIMGEEEYVSNRDGSIRTSVKAKYPCGYDKALEQKAPAKKTIDRPATNEFVPVVDGLNDEALPFN